jgi:hypothetical protein
MDRAIKAPTKYARVVVTRKFIKHRVIIVGTVRSLAICMPSVKFWPKFFFQKY